MPKRVDVLLHERGLAPSRARARSLIEAGHVRLDGRTVQKPSLKVDEDALLEVTQLDHPFVSRGGVKLAGALDAFDLDPTGWVVADLGASTGGFTDCLLQRGAAHVYAIDVGHDQLHERLLADSRVTNMEGVNARHPVALPRAVDAVVIDASFIGLAKLLPTAQQLLTPAGLVLALVKPQFEVGSDHVGKRGVVRDASLRERALQDVVREAANLGLVLRAQADSALRGPEGNQETFVLLSQSPDAAQGL